MRWLIMLITCLLLITCSAKPSLNPTAAAYNTQLGLAYLQNGNMPSAKNKLLLALQESPNDPMILDTMGYFLEKTGDAQVAQQYYLHALALAPHNGATHNNYGAYLCRHKYYRAAIKHFLVAVQDGNYLHVAAAYENAGLCAVKIPDTNLACKYLRKAIHHDPTRISAKRELAKLG